MQEGIRLCYHSQWEGLFGFTTGTSSLCETVALQSYYVVIWNFKYWKMGKKENEMEERR